MIEAAARGTPVVAFRQGSVPEVIDAGVTGMVVDTVDEAVHAISAVLAMSRARVRDVAERRFSASRMATDYLGVYRRLIDGGRVHPVRLQPMETTHG
jgi:glycosyltransferase involved in cell wall biosynthesis